MPSPFNVIGRFIWNTALIVFGLLLGSAVGAGIHDSVTKASVPQFCSDPPCFKLGDEREATVQILSSEAWYHCFHQQPVGRDPGLNPAAPFVFDVFLFGSRLEDRAYGIAVRSEAANDVFKVVRIIHLDGENDFLQGRSLYSAYLRACIPAPNWRNGLLRAEVLAVLVGGLLLIGRIILPGAVVLGAGLMALYPQLMLMLMIIWSLLVARNY